jgi:hypothetical protein
MTAGRSARTGHQTSKNGRFFSFGTGPEQILAAQFFRCRTVQLVLSATDDYTKTARWFLIAPPSHGYEVVGHEAKFRGQGPHYGKRSGDGIVLLSIFFLGSGGGHGIISIFFRISYVRQTILYNVIQCSII